VTGLPDANAYWTAEEFAPELGVSPRWLKDRCAPRCTEPLPHDRFGRQVRFSPAHRAAIKAIFACGPRPTPEPQIDFAKGLAGMRKLHRLQAAKP
jgi:hypothetical protein